MTSSNREKPQELQFDCEIIDRAAQEKFFAKVKMVKKQPIEKSRFERRLEIAHVYITAPADLLKVSSGVSFTLDPAGQVVRSQGKDKILAMRGDRPKDHNHFILFDVAGNGKYIRRSRSGSDVETRPCSIWDLGPEFGNRVTKALTELM